jgi:hypothetical protein
VFGQRIIVVILIAAVIVIVFAIFAVLEGEDNSMTLAANRSDTGALTIISISNNSMIDQFTYLISPNPFGSSEDYIVNDGGINDENNTVGVIEISGIQDGRYILTQLERSSIYSIYNVSKMVEITDQRHVVATFNNTVPQDREQHQHNTTTPIRNIVYNVKFECGTIFGNEGPLRPGHYDTDIGILNKQDFEMMLQWSLSPSDGKNTNSIMKMLEPQGSTSIVCNGLQKILDNDQEFVEGFVLINVPVDPGILASLSEGIQILGRNSEQINLLEVQTFYTANALDQLPHEILVDKITFSIVNDTSGKIPAELMQKTLDITLPSNVNELSDPERKIKSMLAERYGLSTLDLTKLQIEIKNVTAAMGAMIDDHALSLSTVQPQIGR